MRWLTLLALLPTVGCGSNGTTSPSTTPTTLTGTWIYSAGSLTSIAGGYTCVVSSYTLNLVQQGNTLTGSYQGGTINCNGTAVPAGSGAIAGGSVSGSAVLFNFDSPNWHSEGSSTPTSMKGDANVNLTIGGTLYILSGTWTASRQ